MTVNGLYELLDRLPRKCDDFIVRFVCDWDSGVHLEPTQFEEDHDYDCVLGDHDKSQSEERFSVEEMKDFLWNEITYADAKVFVDLPGWKEYFVPMNCKTRPWINWKRKRVEVRIR